MVLVPMTGEALELSARGGNADGDGTSLTPLSAVFDATQVTMQPSVSQVKGKDRTMRIFDNTSWPW